MGLPTHVIQLASKQGGHITRAQLLDFNLSSSAIDRRIEADELKVVTAGVYQIYRPSNHLDIVRGALLTLPGAVVSHQSAAHILRLPRLPALVPTVTVANHTTHRYPGVTVRRRGDLVDHHISKVGDLSVTTPARTAFDLAGILKFNEFESIVEAAILGDRLRSRHFEDITRELARSGKPGSRAANEFIAMRAGMNSKSTVLERKGRLVLVRGGLPRPIPEFPIPWDPEHRFDDAYPPARLALEWDSRTWHQQRAAIRADRERDREAAVHTWLVVRFTWQDVTETPDEVVRTVATLLRERSATTGRDPGL